MFFRDTLEELQNIFPLISVNLYLWNLTGRGGGVNGEIHVDPLVWSVESYQYLTWTN